MLRMLLYPVMIKFFFSITDNGEKRKKK